MSRNLSPVAHDSVSKNLSPVTHDSVSRNLSPVTHGSVSRNLSPVTQDKGTLYMTKGTSPRRIIDIGCKYCYNGNLYKIGMFANMNRVTVKPLRYTALRYAAI